MYYDVKNNYRLDARDVIDHVIPFSDNTKHDKCETLALPGMVQLSPGILLLFCGMSRLVSISVTGIQRIFVP